MPPTETVTTTNSSAISGSFEARTDSGTDRFHFICDIASGGIGRVELAAKVGGRFRRLFAIKRLQDAYRNDPEFLEMFMEEARIAGLVRHPNVVAVLDVGVDARGPFLAMDYVEGVSAEHVVREHRKRGVPTPLQLALAIAIEAAEGLHAAHVTKDAQGRALHLIHRDVSPQNILVGYDGVSRVTDFGIAKAIGRATNTDAGVLKGKLGYMSPEQLRFEELDQRSDIFALGVVLYELLTCTRLYRSQQGMEGPQRILREPPPDVGEARAGLAPELVELVFAMLAKEREARPATCLEVARRLEQVRAEVVEREGRLELAEYVQEFFREQRANHDARIADAVERTDFGRTPRSAATQTRAEGSVAPAPPVTSDPIPTPQPARVARWALGVVGAIVATGVAAYWFASGPAAAPPVAVPVSAPSPSAVPEHAVSPPTTEPPDTAPETEASEARPETEASQPRPGRGPSQRRTPTPARRGEDPPGGPRIWSWSDE